MMSSAWHPWFTYLRPSIFSNISHLLPQACHRVNGFYPSLLRARGVVQRCYGLHMVTSRISIIEGQNRQSFCLKFERIWTDSLLGLSCYPQALDTKHRHGGLNQLGCLERRENTLGPLGEDKSHGQQLAFNTASNDSVGVSMVALASNTSLEMAWATMRDHGYPTDFGLALQV